MQQQQDQCSIYLKELVFRFMGSQIARQFAYLNNTDDYLSFLNKKKYLLKHEFGYNWHLVNYSAFFIPRPFVPVSAKKQSSWKVMINKEYCSGQNKLEFIHKKL